MASDELEAWAAGAKALGDPTRLALADCSSALRLRSRASRQGKMVMYELTGRGRALVAAVAPREEVQA